MSNTWIQTFTGKAFDILEPKIESIDLEDIAHALSTLCRFNGHTNKFYSIAEHCVIMSKLVPNNLAVYALIHDAAEAYMQDMARPLKSCFPNFKDIENNIMITIFQYLGLDNPTEDIEKRIKLADNRMLLAERNQLMKKTPMIWDVDKDIIPYDYKLPCWNWRIAKIFYKHRLKELGLY